MMQISFAFREHLLLSPRTTKFNNALIREGDNFDYFEWLERVRGEEAQAKQSPPVACAQGELAATKVANQPGTSGVRNASPNLASVIGGRPIHKTLWQSHRAPKSKPSQIYIRHRLETVRDAWDEFQSSRARDAVYGYLEAVFAVVNHYKVRRKTMKLLRHASKFGSLPRYGRSDIFAAIIRCTSDGEIDSKTISKWARALRYVARCNVPPTQLRSFTKEAGGVNACADRYAKVLGRVPDKRVLARGRFFQPSR